MWLQRKGRSKVTEDELEEGQYENGEGPNMRKLPLIVIANCIGGVINISPFSLEWLFYWVWMDFTVFSLALLVAQGWSWKCQITWVSSVTL